MKSRSYVLITAAKNEAENIENTIDSVLAQTIQPTRWIITSDASNDGTDEIVERCAAKHDFIIFRKRSGSNNHSFASKYAIIREVSKLFDDVEYEFIGNLDGDIVLPPDYYEQSIRRLEDDPKLGIAGGDVYDKYGDRFVRVRNSRDSVPGAVQVFRRECFEKVEPYLPLPRGGADAAAETSARMAGWKVQSFEELLVKHLRPTSTAGTGALGARFRDGRKDYGLGYHPLFEILKSLYRIKQYPIVLGSLARLAGFFRPCLTREGWDVPDEMAHYVRRAQLDRIGFGFLGRRNEKS